jgi:naphthoate synthase
VARIAFNRPNVRNAFRPKTTAELYQAFMMLKKIPQGVVLFLLKGHQPKTEYTHFVAVEIKMLRHQGYVGDDGQHRLNIRGAVNLFYA